MKNLLAIAALLLLFSCNKKDEEVNLESVCVEGLLYFHDPAVDGPGWFIQVDSVSPKFYPIQPGSIPDSIRAYPRPLSVAACLRETSEHNPYGMAPQPGNNHFYRITSIRRR